MVSVCFSLFCVEKKIEQTKNSLFILFSGQRKNFLFLFVFLLFCLKIFCLNTQKPFICRNKKNFRFILWGGQKSLLFLPVFLLFCVTKECFVWRDKKLFYLKKQKILCFSHFFDCGQKKTFCFCLFKKFNNKKMYAFLDRNFWQ